MKKDIKKNNKESKIKKIIKIIVDALAYTLAIVAIFFIILLGINGCSAKNVVNKQDNIQLDLNRNNAHAVNLNFSNFNSTYGYYIGEDVGLNVLNPIALDTQYYVSLGDRSCAVVRDSNDSMHMLDEQWHVYFVTHAPLIQGDYIRFETPNWTKQWTVQSNLQFELTFDYAPEDYTYEELYLAAEVMYNAENYQTFRTTLFHYFPIVDYWDYDLFHNFDFKELFSVNDYGMCYFEDIEQYTFYQTARYNKNIKLLRDTIFSVNGHIYTDLYINFFESSTYPVIRSIDLMPHNTNYQRYFMYPKTENPVCVMNEIYAYNSNSERFEILWSNSIDYNNFDPSESANITPYYIVSPKVNNGYVSERLGHLRLFEYHLSYTVLITYNNGNIFGQFVSSSMTPGATTLDALNGAFDLIGMAFSGIMPLLALSIGGGITLGGLILVPFTVFIIFAIINLFKR